MVFQLLKHLYLLLIIIINCSMGTTTGTSPIELGPGQMLHEDGPCPKEDSNTSNVFVQIYMLELLICTHSLNFTFMNSFVWEH